MQCFHTLGVFFRNNNFPNSMHLNDVNTGFYITLRREPYLSRTKSFESCFKIFYGCDKQSITSESPLWKLGKSQDKMKFVYANSYSHYMLLSHLLTLQWTYRFMFILEDDCIFNEKYSESWNDAVKDIPCNADIVYLFHHPYHDRENGHIAKHISSKIGYPRGPFSTTAYAVSKKGVKKFVEWFKKDGIYGAFDSVLNIRRRELSVYTLANSICYENKEYGSERLEKL